MRQFFITALTGACVGYGVKKVIGQKSLYDCVSGLLDDVLNLASDCFVVYLMMKKVDEMRVVNIMGDTVGYINNEGEFFRKCIIGENGFILLKN